MFESEENTLDLNNSTLLARGIVGDVVITLSRLLTGDVLLEVSCAGEMVRIGRYPGVSYFQAGQLFQHELSAYKELVR